MLKRPGGVTAAELLKATGWQPHSVRGFLSGTVGKKMGLRVIFANGATSPAYGLGVIPGAAGTLTNAYSLTLGGVTIPAASIDPEWS